MTESTTLDYLITYLRFRVGDMNASRYEDSWLLTALEVSFKQLQRYFGYKYLIDDSSIVTRNTEVSKFLFTEPPVIEPSDESIIILLGAILVLEGSLENTSWDAVAWKDNEISFSNLEKYRTKSDVLKNLIDEFNSIVIPPNKKLARPKKSSLPGFKNNMYERDTEY